jgi:signal transduction histidine kinase
MYIKHISNKKIKIEIAKNQITISDNAGGIPESILDKVFEPNFTTKENTKGTGIGLYMSKKIIDKISGKIEVSNTPYGASFIITV